MDDEKKLTSRLRGKSLATRSAESAPPGPESRLRGRSLGGKHAEIAETTPEFKLEVGGVIHVRDLKVQTPVVSMTYTGKLTVTDVREKESPPRLKSKGGTIGEPSPDRYYTFVEGDTVMTCTASETAVKENLEKIRREE